METLGRQPTVTVNVITKFITENEIMLVREPINLLTPFMFETIVAPDQRVCPRSSNNIDMPPETPVAKHKLV